MLASINPLGERSRNSRFWLTFVAYLVGSIAGGAALGALLGAAGAGAHALVDWTPTVTAAAVLVICAVALAVDLGIGGLALPSIHRQVNEDWLSEYRGWVYGVGFGFQLGLGVVTIVTTATVYVAFVLAFLVASPAAGAVVGATFGLVRALPMLAVGGVREPGRLRLVLGRTERWAPIAQQVARACLLVAAVVGGAAAWGS
jgi:sulfite exporter TauE/SafE